MRLVFVLYKYFPFGGLQRDFLRIALECQNRGHSIRVYTLSWQGERPVGFDIRVVDVKALSNHRRYEKFYHSIQQDLTREPADKIVGFNKMPGLDVYYAADFCYEDMVRSSRGFFYRLTPRYKHFSHFEQAVFDKNGKTKILMISALQQALFEKYYQTPKQRFVLLPPGIAKDRKAPSNAAEIRQAFRSEFNIQAHELLLLQIGSGFKTKGVDRSLLALASLPEALKQCCKMIIIGQDDAKPFLQQIKQLNLTEQVSILKGRSDIPRFLLGADVLVHPAYHENTGTVLLEALVSGLPVMVTDSCGYAHYIAEAKAGVVLTSPFNQTQANQALATMLSDKQQLQQWQANALAFAEQADIYSMPEKAADCILVDAHD